MLTLCYDRSNIQKLYRSPIECFCVFLWISEQTLNISLHIINRVVFTTETKYGYHEINITKNELMTVKINSHACYFITGNGS
jgi:hypothetical protein